jgi:16S rRNA (cytosine1402-N4)-methyltransferase
MTDQNHVPVMLEEVIEGLQLKRNGVYVDATIGAGGHAEAILQRLGSRGILVGIDWDGDAVELATERLKTYGGRARVYRANFADLAAILGGVGVTRADGVLFDLGISSVQLGRAERGFSFQLDGPLDMRMDSRLKLDAQTVVNGTPSKDLAALLRRYGEERKAAQIARAIDRRRRRNPVRTTKELADIVTRAVGPSRGARRIHPATRTFQALRIAVNDELLNLDRGLRAAVKSLKPGGRLCVISFHSLEDRTVKEIFARFARGCICPPGLPVCSCGNKPLVRLVVKKPLVPSEEEVKRNPRSRSAKLRIAERTEEKF